MPPVLSKYSHFRLVWVIFQFRAFKDRRRQDQPGGSDKQLGNRRHWQGAVKVRIRSYIKERGFQYDEMFGIGSGFGGNVQSCESAGMNVFKTCRKNGIKIDRVIKDKIRFFVLLCSKKKYRMRLDDCFNNLPDGSTSDGTEFQREFAIEGDKTRNYLHVEARKYGIFSKR